MCPHRIQIVNRNPTGAPFNTINPILTPNPLPLVRTSSAKITEERVQPGTIRQNILRVKDSHSPSISSRDNSIAIFDGSLGEGRVENRGVGWEGDGGDGVGLVVGCFGLDLALEDVLGVGELVLVEGVVFDGCADEPDGAGRFVEEAAAGVDCDLG